MKASHRSSPAVQLVIASLSRPCAAITLSSLLLCCDLNAAQTTAGPLKLPTRAFVVTGGSIAMQGGVMRSPDMPSGRIGKFRHPTRYFLTLVNETNTPVWIDLEWRFPGEDAKQFRTGRIEPDKSYQSWRNTFGVVSDKPIGLRIVVFADEARARPVGSEETFFLFTRDERDAFIRATFSQRQNTIMTGWPEMGRVATDVPGTLADAELQTDIQLLLWKEESKQHRDCKHEAVRAEPVPPDSSVIIADLLADSTVTAAVRSLVERAQDATQPGVVRVEHWLLKSCEAVTAYEVLLVASAGGGTDVVARPIRQRDR